MSAKLTTLMSGATGGHVPICTISQILLTNGSALSKHIPTDKITGQLLKIAAGEVQRRNSNIVQFGNARHV